MGIAIKEKAINSGPISLIDFFNLENLELLDNYCVATKKSANSVFVFSQKKLKRHHKCFSNKSNINFSNFT